MNQPHFLKNIFTNDKFTAAEQETIISKFTSTSFKKNDYLLQEGKVENLYWFVQEGYIRSYVTDVNGNDISTNFYSAWEVVIDWASFFLRQSTRENIQALTDCVCWQLDFENFQTLFHSINSFREQGRTNLVSSYFSLKSKSIAMIADQAKDRYVQLLQQKPSIVQNVSLKHIATYLGITDTSLSRIRKELAGQ